MDLEKAVIDLQKDMAAAEEQHRTIFRRLDKSEKLADSVSELALSVRDLVNSQKTTDGKVDKLCKTVEDIKEKPAKRWDTVVEKALLAVVGALVAFALARFGL